MKYMETEKIKNKIINTAHTETKPTKIVSISISSNVLIAAETAVNAPIPGHNIHIKRILSIRNIPAPAPA
jgi:hypothetical protein